MSEFWKTVLPLIGSIGSVIAGILITAWVGRRQNRANTQKAGAEGGKAAAEGEVAYSKDALEWRKQAMTEVAEAKAEARSATEAARVADEKAEAAEGKADQCARDREADRRELQRLSDAVYGCTAPACPVLDQLTR